MFTAALVAGLATLGSFRFDSSRVLVELDMSFDSFVSRVDPGKSLFAREDFEQIDHDRCVHAHMQPFAGALATVSVHLPFRDPMSLPTECAIMVVCTFALVLPFLSLLALGALAVKRHTPHRACTM